MRELLKINTSDAAYGIWKDEIKTISVPKSVNRLPFSHFSIAGVTIINERLVTLADLPACLGLSPVNKKNPAQLLYISGEMQIAGFLIQGDTSYIQVPPDAVYSIPEYFHIPIINTCIIHDNIIIPVIDIKVLLNRVQNADYELTTEKAFIENKNNKILSDKQFRLIQCRDQSYVLCASSFYKSIMNQQITDLFLTPDYIEGLIFHDNRILPVINLMKRMDISAEKSDLMLVCKILDQDYSFIITADKGSLDSIHSIISDFPVIARSQYMDRAVILNDEIIPVINTDKLISENEPIADYKSSFQTGYNIDNNLKSSISHEDINVVEFLLLGMKHAVPKSEAVKTLDLIPYREIPNVLPVIAGLAIYDNKLLPVLDLAMCFGMRSNVSGDWQMILIENGNFQALVLTEKVLNERTVPAGIQRDMPFELEHDIVYVCYPDDKANAIRLVLNVYALAVYFNKDMVKELFKAFSHDIKSATAEVVSSLFEAEEPIYENDKIEDQEDLCKKDTAQGSEITQIIHEIKLPSPDTYVAPQIYTQTNIGKEASETITHDDRYEHITLEDKIPFSDFDKEIITDSHQNISADMGSDKSEIIDKQFPFLQDTTPPDKDTPLTTVQEEEERLEEKTFAVTEDKKKEEVHAATRNIDKVRDEISFENQSAGTSSSKQNILKYAYAAAAIIIVILFISVYFTQDSNIKDKIDNSKSEKITEPAENQQSVLKEPEKESGNTSVSAEKKIPQITYKTIIHDVIKGDTLYNITKSYTGNGWDFNKVASENNIENPDLIFPEQKIKIIIPEK